MPIEYKSYRMGGEVVEKGPEISAISHNGGEERYGVRVQNVLSKQNDNISRGRITLENSKRTLQLKEEIGADKFAIQVDDHHNIGLIKDTDNDGDLDFTETEVLTSTEIVNFVILNNYLIQVSSSKVDQKLLEKVLDVQLEQIDITSEHIHTHLEEIKSASWKNINEHTDTATISGDIESSNHFEKEGEPVWAVGKIEHKKQAHTIGLSVSSNTVILYGDDDLILSAELVRKVTQLNN